MKETVHLCLSTVFRNQAPPPLSLMRPSPTQLPLIPGTGSPVIPDASSKFQVHFGHALKVEASEAQSLYSILRDHQSGQSKIPNSLKD